MTGIAVPRCAVVTGGAGFIGSHVVDRLLDLGCDRVVVLDDLSSGQTENIDGRADFFQVDVASPFAPRAIASVDPDAIFHLAARIDVATSFVDPIDCARTNILGTIYALEAARRTNAKVVLASTGGAIYGECDHPAVEDDPLDPISPYAVSKLAAEYFLLADNRVDRSEHVVLRYANVYGPRQLAALEGGVVAVFLDQRSKGEPATLFGGGTQTRDFVSVADVVDATVRAFGLPAGIYNVGTGIETAIVELAEILGLETVAAPARPGDLGRSVIDPDRLWDALDGDWNPRPLAVGLAEMVEPDHSL